MEGRPVGEMHERNPGLGVAPGAHPAIDCDRRVLRGLPGEDRAHVELHLVDGARVLRRGDLSSDRGESAGLTMPAPLAHAGPSHYNFAGFTSSALVHRLSPSAQFVGFSPSALWLDVIMRRSRSLACSLGLAALTIVPLHCPARAQSADLVPCHRIAADPSDPDKPAGVQGVRDIAPSDIATAIKFCKTASASSRRAMYQLGRAYAANQQLPDAIAAYRRAADKGSTAAMVELGVMYG